MKESKDSAFGEKKRGEGRGLGLTPTSETCFFSSPLISPVLKLFGIRAAKGHKAK